MKTNQPMKKLSAVALAALTATAFATPAKADPRLQQHYNLYNTLERAGVGVFWNDQELCEDNWGGGMYVTYQGRAAMMICQDNGEGVVGGGIIPMTANDGDSLRHEAQHVVQDCVDGGIGDGELEPMLDLEALDGFVKKGLPAEKISWIVKTYLDNGADRETVIIELEAFAVAANIDPDRIANALNRFCF